jgi:hypothetical protein
VESICLNLLQRVENNILQEGSILLTRWTITIRSFWKLRERRLSYWLSNLIKEEFIAILGIKEM